MAQDDYLLSIVGNWILIASARLQQYVLYIRRLT